jgi:prepilin-type processing-associated H-X9-DG protein
MSTRWLSWDDFLGIGYDGRNLVPSEVNLQVLGITPTYPTPNAISWIYNCPLDKRSHDKLVARSYCINLEIAASQKDTHYSGTNLTRIANAGQSLLMAERIADTRPVTANDFRGSVIGNDEYAGFSNGNRPGATTTVTYCDLDASAWISNHPRSGDLPWLFVDGHVELRNRTYFQDFLVH